MARHRRSRTHRYRSKRVRFGSLGTQMSRKVMPRVKSGLESVGSQVISKGSNTIPYLQRLTRKLMGVFSTKKRGRSRR